MVALPFNKCKIVCLDIGSHVTMWSTLLRVIRYLSLKTVYESDVFLSISNKEGQLVMKFSFIHELISTDHESDF